MIIELRPKKALSWDEQYILNQKEDEQRRIEATRGLAKESWPIIFFPFSIPGLISFFFNWKVGLLRFLLGVSVGVFFYLWALNIMRYGKEA